MFWWKIYLAGFALEALYQAAYSWSADEDAVGWIGGQMAAISWPVTLWLNLRRHISE